jgi:calmodulin
VLLWFSDSPPVFPQDRESTGYLDVVELRYILSGLGQPLAPNDVEGYIAEADPHGTGQVDYTAFVNMVAGALAQVG